MDNFPQSDKHVELIKKEYGLDRFNVIDYLKTKDETIDKLYTPSPDFVTKYIIEKTKNEKQHGATFWGVYSIFLKFQNEINEANISWREKCRKFFGMTFETVNKIIKKLEELGLIIQVMQKRKKIILVKYPEYINHVEKLTGTKITIEEETTERIITEKKTTKRVIIEPKEQNNKIIESKNYQEIPEPPDRYNQKQLTKIQQDFKISIDKLSQEEIEKTIYNHLNKYIDWNNNIDKKSIIEKPVIFINKYLDNPLSLTIDFTQYYAYLKKLDKEKTIKENKKQQEKLEQGKQEKEILINNLYKTLKEYNKDEYKKLYEKYKKELLTTNNFLRMRYNSGKTSMLDIVIEGEIKKELAKKNNICL